MKKTLFNLIELIFLIFAFDIVKCQRVAPGVPPQQYQHDMQYQQQQYQQQPQQYQQQPQQYQQQPYQQPQQQQYQQPQQQYQQQPPQHQQQQQQPPQHQQAPPVPQQHQQPPAQQAGHGHAHGHHGQQQQVLNAANIQQERAHIAEHMDVPIDTSKMSEQELQFHYFKMHDSDNNNKLDGCELIKSLIHWHEQGSKEPHTDGKPQVEEKVFSDDELVALIDPILTMDDSNRDGFIDYPEFIKAQQKAQKQNQQQEQKQPQP